MSATIQVYNPIAAASEGTAASGRKLESLRGKVIGFIDNAKPNFNFLVDDLAQLLDRAPWRRSRAQASQAGAGAGHAKCAGRVRRGMRCGDHGFRRLRLLHVVEYPRQCRSGEAGTRGRHDLLDRVHRSGTCPGESARHRRPPDRRDPASVRRAHTRTGARASRTNVSTIVAHLACLGDAPSSPTQERAAPGASRAELVAVPQDADEMNRSFLEQGWSDGLPMVPPTQERVARMLRHTKRTPDEVVSRIAPGLGAATVERIAINAVMAGCYPEYLPVLIAAAEAVAHPGSISRACRRRPTPLRCG